MSRGIVGGCPTTATTAPFERLAIACQIVRFSATRRSLAPRLRIFGRCLVSLCQRGKIRRIPGWLSRTRTLVRVVAGATAIIAIHNCSTGSRSQSCLVHPHRRFGFTDVVQWCPMLPILCGTICRRGSKNQILVGILGWVRFQFIENSKKQDTKVLNCARGETSGYQRSCVGW